MACLVLVGNWKNKKQKHNKWKDIVKKTKKKKKNKKKNKERQHTLGWEEKMMLDFGSWIAEIKKRREIREKKRE
jgi:hypothetical protein